MVCTVLEMAETSNRQSTNASPAPRRRRSETTPRERRRYQRAQEQEAPEAPSRRREAPADTGRGTERGASDRGRERRAVGRRRVVSRRRRRRSRARVTIAIVVLAAIAVGVVAVVTGLVDRAIDLVAPDEVEEASDDAPGDLQPAVVLVTHDETDPSGQATGLAVLAYDRDTGQGTVLLVPAATVADVPGYGAFQLGEAHAFGQGPLVWVTLDNLIGTRFDGVAGLSEQGWAALLSRVGGFTIDVGSRLIDRSDGGGQVRFEAGEQFLDGPRLAEYLAFRADGETELEALPRVQQVIMGLLDRLVEEPTLLDDVFADDAPMIDTADPELVRTVLSGLATAREVDEVTTLTLPVTTLGSGRDDLYRVDGTRLRQLVDDRFAASRLSETVGAGRSVQVLNGNGVPGIGQPVAERLADGGYRIVLTGNADRFDYQTTRIIIYDESDEAMAMAADIRERLGAGQVERSATPQSVVDVTIVVGHDFPPQ